MVPKSQIFYALLVAKIWHPFRTLHHSKILERNQYGFSQDTVGKFGIGCNFNCCRDYIHSFFVDFTLWIHFRHFYWKRGGWFSQRNSSWRKWIFIFVGIVLRFSFYVMVCGEKNTSKLPNKILFDGSCCNYRDSVHAIKLILNLLLRVYIRELHCREYIVCGLCCNKFTRNHLLRPKSWFSNPFKKKEHFHWNILIPKTKKDKNANENRISMKVDSNFKNSW